jgi:hypothetical protein
MNKTKIPVRGGCHCGAVIYEVTVSRQLLVHECNCSICSKSGYLHLIVPAKDFRLLSGKDQLSEYRFNTGMARHLFCSQCGIKSFYVPRSNPDGYSVNVNCLDLPGKVVITVEEFDGQNWELNAGALVQLGKDD